MSRMIVAVMIWALCIVTAGLGEVASAADAIRKFKSLRVPDYTKITGFIPNVTLPAKEPVVLWKAVTEEEKQKEKFETVPLTDPVIAGEVMYFGSDTGHLTAFHIKNRLILWTHEHGQRIAVEPSLRDDFVFFGSGAGITALHRENGELAWQHAIPDGAGESTPIPIGKQVFASGYDGQAYALDLETGRVLWQHDFVADAPADPSEEFAGNKARLGTKPARPRGAASDGKVFVQAVFDQSRVIALDCTTGERRWSFQTKGWIGAAPVIAEGKVFIPSQDKHLYCVNLSDGKELWKYSAPRWLASSPAVHQGKVYLPVHRAQLHELELESGKLIRILEPPEAKDREGAVYSFPLISERTIYFAAGSTGLLFAFDLESGAMRWKLRPSEGSELFSSPTTDGQRLFVTCRQSGNQREAGENAILVIGAEE